MRNNTKTPLVLVTLRSEVYELCKRTLAAQYAVHCFSSEWMRLREGLGTVSPLPFVQPWVAGKPLTLALAVQIPQARGRAARTAAQGPPPRF